MERRTGADALPGWRETPAKQAVLDLVHAVTAPDSPDWVIRQALTSCGPAGWRRPGFSCWIFSEAAPISCAPSRARSTACPRTG
jgi:hypothetical protein